MSAMPLIRVSVIFAGSMKEFDRMVNGFHYAVILRSEMSRAAQPAG